MKAVYTLQCGVSITTDGDGCVIATPSGEETFLSREDIRVLSVYYPVTRLMLLCDHTETLFCSQDLHLELSETGITLKKHEHCIRLCKLSSEEFCEVIAFKIFAASM